MDSLKQSFPCFGADYHGLANDMCRRHIELVALALLIEVLTPALLGALGFCGEGVLEESFAAWWQSTIGNVPYGSLFSKLQSLAARYGKSLPIR
ncbi:hypothetical protein D6D01_02586 [Aureobasidium pullulans]|uniref:Uncharacterized protein n=1 Tax=Aureobasidium pullulans TaxID=5580 RepID=A0A4S9LRP5_AURPU|nr:hypothetical protein D6D01_02586 [Aureobasidium pullulans]